MKRIKNIIVMLLLAFAPCCMIWSQDFDVTASIDSSFLLIGEQACLSFDVNQSQEDKIHLPLFSDTIVTGLELVERLKPDTTYLPNNRISVKHSFVITSFDTALYYIPSFPVYNDNGDTLESSPMVLTVFTIDVDTTQFEVADIKPIYTPPFDLKGFFLIVLWVLLGLLLVFGIYWLIRKYIKKEPLLNNEALEPERPAHEVALEALDQIKNEKRWEKVEPKVYYTDVTDVVRTYIGKRYDLNAMESTSDEIVFMLRDFDLSKGAMSSLREMLQLADLVKFAKWQPIYDEYLKTLSDAYSFVNETKVEDVVTENNDKVKVEE